MVISITNYYQSEWEVLPQSKRHCCLFTIYHRFIAS